MTTNIYLNKLLNKEWEGNVKEYSIFLKKNNREPTHREMAWVNTTKKAFQNGKLTQERIDTILKINPNFFDVGRKSFEERLQEYKEFVEVHKREPKTREFRWVDRIKELYMNGELTQVQIDEILKINPDFFEQKNKGWNINIMKYSKFFKDNQRDPTQKEMRWVNTIKNDFKRGKLLQKQIDEILKINPNFFEKGK